MKMPLAVATGQTVCAREEDGRGSAPCSADHGEADAQADAQIGPDVWGYFEKELADLVAVVRRRARSMGSFNTLNASPLPVKSRSVASISSSPFRQHGAHEHTESDDDQSGRRSARSVVQTHLELVEPVLRALKPDCWLNPESGRLLRRLRVYHDASFRGLGSGWIFCRAAPSILFRKSSFSSSYC